MGNRIAIKEPKYGFYPDLKERAIEVQKGEDDIYTVFLDGEEVGKVYKSTRTWERRSKGHRYVNARGETPTWRIEGNPYWDNFDTRAEAAFYLANGVIK